MDTIYLPWGRIEFGNNEVTIISTVEDPPKFRMASAAGISLGAVSWNRLRPDGGQEEMVLVQGKQDERVRHDSNDHSGELTIHIRDGSVPSSQGDGMVKVLEARHDGIWFKPLDRIE